jgi:hypothetical protein
MEFPDWIDLKVCFLSDVQDENPGNSEAIQCLASPERGLVTPEMVPESQGLGQHSGFRF